MSDDPLKTAQTFLYYSFGRAAEAAQLMEKELVTLVLIPAMLRKTPIDSAELESLIAKLSKSTLGQLLKELDPATQVNEEAAAICADVLARRNTMMHRLFTANADKLDTVENVNELIQEIEENERRFGGAYVTFREINHNLESKYGITPKSIAAFLEAVSTV